jgi:hypothetical protein
VTTFVPALFASGNSLPRQHPQRKGCRRPILL